MNTRSSRSRSSLLVLVIATFLSACSNATVKTDVISKDELLNTLVAETDFPGNWTWLDSQLVQSEKDPLEDNFSLVRSATSTLTGFYDPNHYYVRIYNNVRVYRETQVIGRSLDVNLGIENEETVNLNFTSQYPLTSKCVREPIVSSDTAMFCKIVTNYGTVVSTLTFYVPSVMGQGEVEELFNKVLAQVESRINQYIVPSEK